MEGVATPTWFSLPINLIPLRKNGLILRHIVAAAEGTSMPDAYQSDGRSSVKRGLAKIAYDFAALKMEFLARRYGVEIKYDPHQFRVPAGQRTGGQWAKTPSGSVGAKRTAGSLGARALGALASNPEAAPAAGAVALPLMAGGIGISR